MPRDFGPMLAAQFDDEEMEDLERTLRVRRIQFPLLGSPKIDGIRVMFHEGIARSRSWKPLPNRLLQALAETNRFNFLDAEVIVGTDPASPGLFNRTQSAIMTADADVELSLWVFDNFYEPDRGFAWRHAQARDCARILWGEGLAQEPYLNIVKHSMLDSPYAVLQYEEEALEAGYEGIMLRHPNMPYKFGRSTIKQQGLIKIKRFHDAEAKIVGFRALERNTNPPQKDAFGLQKRSSHRAGKVADELLGKLVVSQQPWGEFEIGSGFDVATREEIWQNQEAYLGRIVTFKYQPHGMKDKPRAPIFKGFRPEVE